MDDNVISVFQNSEKSAKKQEDTHYVNLQSILQGSDIRGKSNFKISLKS